jgi:N6-L-threonylcarbamoyladenine synthase
VVDRLAELGDPTTFTFSAPRIKDPRGALDYSFSGLKTMAIRTAARLSPLPLPDPANPPQAILDLLASFRHTIVDWLLAPFTELASRHHPRLIAAAGGVAANRELRRRLEAWGAAAGLPVLLPPVSLTTDNAAMIARAGQLKAAAGTLEPGGGVQPYPRAAFKQTGPAATQ